VADSTSDLGRSDQFKFIPRRDWLRGLRIAQSNVVSLDVVSLDAVSLDAVSLDLSAPSMHTTARSCLK
jgi:hypothetical protein